MEDRLSSSPGKVCFYPIDILKKENLLKVLKGCKQVVHLAAQTGVIPSREDPLNDARVNITGTLNLLDGSVKSNVQRFIFASSAAALGKQAPPLHEKKVPKPAAPYGAAKLAGEAYCSAFYRSYGLDTVVLRFSNVYGPHSFHKGSVVAHFIKKILKNKPLPIYGDGEQTRDFLFARDLTRVILEILQTDSKKIKGEIKQNVASIEKIKKRLGYEPQFDLEEELKLTWKWFEENWQK